MTSITRPPAIPLFVHDPSFSVWSTADRVADDWPKHWTGYVRGAAIIARIDGQPWAALGPTTGRKLEQVACEVLPTRTILRLRGGGVDLAITFLSPLLPDDLDVLSRPLTYVLVDATANDGKAHQVQVYADIGAEWATDDGSQSCLWMRQRVTGLDVMRVGNQDQRVLGRSGDNLRCDWGYITVAVPQDGRQSTAMGDDAVLRGAFIAGQALPHDDDLRQPRPAFNGYVKLAVSLDLGAVGAKPSSAWFLVGFDEGFCIEYLHRKLRPYWQRDGRGFDALLKQAATELPSLRARCEAFDNRLLADCERMGGKEYRDLCALSYRQAIAGHKLAADADGTPLFFSKENFSNGCIATVDVTYPSAPLFLLVNPALLEGMTTPILQYAASPRWRFPFAPHDLGTYPLANGQVYGGGEISERDQMPVEECGNMLILVAAICHARGNADYAKPWWKLLCQWADYLVDKGLDPDNQLCTDDFAGHLAHNTNLSIKAIIALACQARIAQQLGHTEPSRHYRAVAERMAKDWLRMADDGDHYRLTFDKAGTWSQKYNLVWDKLLGLDLFPAEVARREVAFYLKQQQPYGLPLDSRRSYTKLDWIVWSATLAERPEDFRALVSPLIRWCNETSSRVPLTDWYDTVSGKQEGFQARSVVGGLFIALLADGALWRSWSQPKRQAAG